MKRGLMILQSSKSKRIKLFFDRLNNCNILNLQSIKSIFMHILQSHTSLDNECHLYKIFKNVEK